MKKEFNIKQNLVKIILILIIIVTSFFLVKNVEDYNQKQFLQNHIKEISSLLNQEYFMQMSSTTKYISMNQNIKDVLTKKTLPNNEKLSAVLDITKSTHHAQIVYVMDNDGNVIGSTTYQYNSTKTLVGNNYAFRPYFQNALKNNKAIYAAVGVTTKKRGIYFSHAVKDKNKVIGVVVIKIGVEKIDNFLKEYPFGISIISPEGIIFASNKDNLYHTIEKIENKTINKIKKSRQFNTDDIKIDDWNIKNNIAKINDEQFYIFEQNFQVPGWKIILYENVNKKIPLNDFQIFVLSVGIGVSLSLLFIVIMLITVNNKKNQAEKKLEEYNKNLEKIVKKRTKELEKANKEIKGLLELKSEFVNQIAHDLRNPLTPILIQLPLIKSNLKNKLSSKEKKMMNNVINNANYLSELITDTLNISRLDSKKNRFVFREENIYNIIKEVIENNKPTFNQEKIKIEDKFKHKNILVNVDRLRIKELINNLFSNSIKYMENKDKKLIINSKIKNKELIVSIKDTGKGIEKENLKKIFELFFKESSESKKPSWGLGLSICTKIIKKHGGKIWAESKGLGKGTTFYFTLPLAKK